MSQTPVPSCQCGTCGRNFHPDVVERHTNICQKNIKSALKRKTFDSSKMRARDTELEKLQNEQKFMPTHLKPDKPKLSTKKSDWRAKHDNFVKTIRAARGDYPEPNHLQKEATAYVDPDYVQCQYCTRRFNGGAAERHIPFCKEQHDRVRHKAGKEDASDRMSRRNQYKAPLPKSAQKKLPVSSVKDMKTRSLYDGIESNPSSIPTTNPKQNKQSNRNGPSGGNLSSTRDLSRDKCPPVVNKELRKTPSQISDSELSKNIERKDRIVGKRRDRRTMDLNQMASDSAQPNNSSDIPYNFPSHLPSLRKKSHSASSLGSNGSNGSSHKDVPLNDYGTPMAKFCYECGGRYPVPQAKFCCMCGTKRI